MSIGIFKNDICPYNNKCGACQLQHMTYKRQLAFKMKKATSLLGTFASVNPIIGMKNPMNYRNKVQAAFAPSGHNGIVSGLYETSTHTIVPINECMLDNEIADEIIVYIRGMLPRYNLKPYNENTKQGFLRHVLIRRGYRSHEIMVVLITSIPTFNDRNNFLRELIKKFPDITTVIQNINNEFTSMVLGARSIVLYGKGYIEDSLCGCVFRISPKSFYQINSLQTEKLYEKAIEYAELTDNDDVLDAYCGIGTIGLIASSLCHYVVGVEINEDAVKDAISNAKRNGISNAYFINEDSGKYMRSLAEDNTDIAVVFIDPPRTGCDMIFLRSLLKLRPRKIIYISCGINTLARDLGVLTKGPYRVNKIQPVDMFPFTEHVETIVMLTRTK